MQQDSQGKSLSFCFPACSNGKCWQEKLQLPLLIWPTSSACLMWQFFSPSLTHPPRCLTYVDITSWQIQISPPPLWLNSILLPAWPTCMTHTAAYHSLLPAHQFRWQQKLLLHRPFHSYPKWNTPLLSLSSLRVGWGGGFKLPSTWEVTFALKLLGWGSSYLRKIPQIWTWSYSLDLLTCMGAWFRYRVLFSAYNVKQSLEL